MKKLFLLPAFLFAACGDNLAPADQQTSGVATDPASDDVSRAIEASIFIDTPSCTGAVAAFEAGVQYADDGTPVGSVECRWTFDDGTTSDECVGQHEFADGGNHDFVLDVTDTLTGETAHVTQQRYIYPALTAELEVTAPACGLEASYSASVSVPAELHVSVQEQDKVVEQSDGVIRFSEAGTYTIVLVAEDERPTGPICEARVEKQVTVSACDVPCDH